MLDPRVAPLLRIVDLTRAVHKDVLSVASMESTATRRWLHAQQRPSRVLAKSAAYSMLSENLADLLLVGWVNTAEERHGLRRGQILLGLSPGALSLYRESQHLLASPR